jgi:formiminotetrahydrofolate cyclodeaminase
MVARICAEGPKYADRRAAILKIARQADGLRADLLATAPLDEAAFAAVIAAQALPRATDAQKMLREQTLEDALHEAAAVPLHAAQLALDVQRLAVRALDLRNRNLASDVGCAAEFAASAISACAYNVRINHRFMKSQASIAAQNAKMARCEREANALLQSVRRAVRSELTRA